MKNFGRKITKDLKIKILILSSFSYINRKLIKLLESENEKNVAIACYDLGEFCRFHPFGKKLVSK